MRVLMLGWEFPPHHSGGLGVACEGLSRALAEGGTDITFVLPYAHEHAREDIAFTSPKTFTMRRVTSGLYPYATPDEYAKGGPHGAAAPSLFEEVVRYGEAVAELEEDDSFDIIHAHDWLSFPAGVALKKRTGKPLVLHVHLPSLDQGGDGGHDSRVKTIECAAFETADAVIAISHRVKDLLVEEYGVTAGKVTVIHNGVDPESLPQRKLKVKGRRGRSALFMGRLTHHKGPDIFLNAAAKVAKYDPDLLFVVAGSGELQYQLMHQAAASGIGRKVFFTGFLRGEERRALLADADMLVMPSVAEPFGLIALEAAMMKVPTVLSKQSGAREVLQHSLTADFWDVDKFADHMVSLSRHAPLRREISRNAFREASGATWKKTADLCVSLYESLI